jgi:hypothetical protein
MQKENIKKEDGAPLCALGPALAVTPAPSPRTPVVFDSIRSEPLYYNILDI